MYFSSTNPTFFIHYKHYKYWNLEPLRIENKLANKIRFTWKNVFKCFTAIIGFVDYFTEFTKSTIVRSIDHYSIWRRKGKLMLWLKNVWICYEQIQIWWVLIKHMFKDKEMFIKNIKLLKIIFILKNFFKRVFYDNCQITQFHH